MEADRYLAGWEPGHCTPLRTPLRTPVAPAMLKAGFRLNAIPSGAEAPLGVRALPDEDVPRFLDELRCVTGGRLASAPSRLDTVMFRALETVQRRLYPGAVTIPAMLAGAAGNAQLRARGVQAYGFGPAVSAGDGPIGGAHADNERIAVNSLVKLVEYLWLTILEVAASK